MKQVFSMETEWDKDLQTLAETTVMCRLKRKSGSCRERDCGCCPTFGRLSVCMEQLSECDVLRVQNMAQEMYSYKAFQYGLDKPSAREILRDAGEAAAVGALSLVGISLAVAAMLAFILVPLFIFM